MRLSTAILFALFSQLAAAGLAQAHPAAINSGTLHIDRATGRFELTVQCDVVCYIMGTPPGHMTDELMGLLQGMSDKDVADEIARKQLWYEAQLSILGDGKEATIESVTFPAADKVRDVQRGQGEAWDSARLPITVKGTLPRGAERCTVRFPLDLGVVVLSVMRDGGQASVVMAPAGKPTGRIVIDASAAKGPNEQSPKEQSANPATEPQQDANVATKTGNPTVGEPTPAPVEEPSEGVPAELFTASNFLAIGIWHIVPQGLDHILFVLGLFLLSPTLKPLLWQVTAFTLAHSVTLALAMHNVVRLSPAIVEPLIAASIAFIAIENIFTSKLQPWRPAMVFAFGLLHGLGFAGVLLEQELPANHFVPALIGFNVGVEMGQLLVIAGAMLAVGWFRHWNWYRATVTIPASLVIACVGIYWAVERAGWM